MFADKRWGISNILMILLGVGTLLVLWFVPGCACNADSMMKCCWTMRVEAWLGCIMLVLAAGQLFLRGKEARRLSSFVLALISAFAIVMMTPIGIGLCAKAEMACRHLGGCLRILYIAILVVALFQMIFPVTDPEKQKKRW